MLPDVGAGPRWHTGAMRDAFDLDPAVVHLNHGSFGAVPRPVAEAQQRIRARAEANPMRFFRVEALGAARPGARGRGVVPRRRVPTRWRSSATSPRRSRPCCPRSPSKDGSDPGDVVVLSGSGLRVGAPDRRALVRAHGSVVRRGGPRRDRRARARRVPRRDRPRRRPRSSGSGSSSVDQIASPDRGGPARGRRRRGRAEGRCADLRRRRARAGSRRADPAATGADFWSGTWHKWGFAPRGTSALWVAEPESAADRAADHELEPRAGLPGALRHARHRRLLRPHGARRRGRVLAGRPVGSGSPTGRSTCSTRRFPW